MWAARVSASTRRVKKGTGTNNKHMYTPHAHALEIKGTDSSGKHYMRCCIRELVKNRRIGEDRIKKKKKNSKNNYNNNAFEFSVCC